MDPDQDRAGASAPATGHPNPWVVLSVLCLGFFMILLDTTIVNVAIPSIIDGLHASLDQILWVLNSYILVYAVLLITAGRLGDLFGQGRMFVAGLVIFTAASFVCGFAQDVNQLIAARVVQGVGGALLTPQTLSLITALFPPQRRGAAMGVWGGVAGIAAVAGPTLGGVLTTYGSWRWVFYVNVPIGIFAAVAAWRLVPNFPSRRARGYDPVGVLLAVAGLFGVCFGLIEGQRYDWGTVTGFVTIPMLIGGGVAVLVLFVAWERLQTAPLIPLSVFANRNFSLMSWVSAIVAFAMLGLFLPLTIYLQSALGFSALQAGLTTAPMPLTSMVLAPLAGRMSDRIGGKYILLVGLALFAAGMGIVDAVASAGSHWWTFLPGLVVAGVGLGCTFAPMTTVAMRTMRPDMAGAASGILNTTRQLGGVIGSAVVGAVLQNRLAIALHDEAVSRAGQLPPQFRRQFVDAFTSAAKGGLEVGRGQSAAKLPPGIPPEIAARLAAVFHDTFVHAFVDAMRPSLVVPVVALALGSASCLLIRRRGSGQGRPSAAPTSTPARRIAAS